MILKASQRGGAARLARHLMNVRDNEHVDLHELRGFVSDERLEDALAEAQAIAKGTRCEQFLFSLSLNPPEGESVNVESFEAAIEMAEQRLGLDGQPRADVFHEKEGRRHAHAVWSRIDAETMTARPVPFFKNRLMEVSREMYLQHGWEMPKGMADRAIRNPLNFSRAEWQQAQRIKQDPRLVKAMFKDVWQRSDTPQALQAALEEKGYYLARGDRRGVVAVDYRGEAYALSRWSGVKAKDIRARLGNADALPALDDQRKKIAGLMGEKLRREAQEIEDSAKRLRPAAEMKRMQMVERHRADRTAMSQTQKVRASAEAAERAAKLPSGGIGKLWSRITGKYSKQKSQNEHDAWQSLKRDQAERDRLIARQLDERQRLQAIIKNAREERAKEIAEIRQEIASYLLVQQGKLEKMPDRPVKEQPKVQPRTQPRQQPHERSRDQGRERTRDRGYDFER